MKNKKGFWALNIGLLYILPWLVGFILFKVYPFLSSPFLQLHQLRPFQWHYQVRHDELREDLYGSRYHPRLCGNV